MIYCIHPSCPDPHNSNSEKFCLACQGELLLNGRYRPVKVLSAGGFSTTYEVDDRGSPKVLKVLNLEKFPNPKARQKALSLFQREARVLSQLDRRGIPKADGYFSIQYPNRQDPLHCLVMEKIEGVNLEAWLQQRGSPISETLAIQWLQQLVKLLQEVHSKQFFHRDIKPSNIMVQANGNLALIDFGTVRDVTGTDIADLEAGEPGTAIVSRGYAPPEQEKGHTVEQSDFFALGRTWVYLLTGKHPLDFYDAYTDELRWRSAAPDISPQLADFIDRLMAHLPGQRPPNTKAILQELAQIAQVSSMASPIALGAETPAIPPIPVFALDKTLTGHSDAVWSVAIDPGNHILVSGSWDKTIKVWNLATGQVLRTLKGHSDAVWSVALSRDVKTLVSGSSDRTIKIWNLPAGKLIRTLKGHSNWVAAVALTPDGTTIVSGSSDKTIKLWDLASGQLMNTLTGHFSGVTCLAISIDGNTLVSGSGDKTLKLWNLKTGELRDTLTGHSAAVTCVAIAPDGKTIISGDLEKSIKIWDFQTGEEKNTLSGHSGTVWSVAISTAGIASQTALDAQTLVSGSRDKMVKMWDLSTGELLATLTSDRGAVHDIAIAVGGEIIVSAGNDWNVKIWRSRRLP